MPQPTPYVVTRDFSADEAGSVAGRSAVLTAAVDAELANIATTISETLANLALIQRDDGVIANASIGIDQLKAEVSVGIADVTNWLTATDYTKRHSVWEAGALYYCLVDHASGVFATDLAANKWTLIIDLSAYDASAATSATASELSNQASQTAQGLSEAARDASIVAKDASVTAQGLSEAARDLSIAAKVLAETAVTDSQAEVTYAEEWANKAEDSLVSAAAGGDAIDDYSALHHAKKAAASAATSADLASTVAGTDTYTATLGISAYTAGKTYYLSIANTNTIAAPTINFDAKGAKTIKNLDGSALAIGSIPTEAFFRYNGVNMILLNPNPVRLGYIYGLAISNNVTDALNDIDIATGECAAKTGETLNLASGLTKQIDVAFAAGTNAGGMFTGAVAINTWYHMFLIRKDSDGTVDAGFDTSVTAANIPVGYTAYRRIGSVLTDGAGNIIQFIQNGNRFIFDVVSADIATTHSSAAVLDILSTPLGIKTTAIINVYSYSGSVSATPYMLITDPSQTDTAPTSSLYNFQGGFTAGVITIQEMEVVTNISSQIRHRSSLSNTSIQFNIKTLGWIDNRGQN